MAKKETTYTGDPTKRFDCDRKDYAGDGRPLNDIDEAYCRRLGHNVPDGDHKGLQRVTGIIMDSRALLAK